MQDKTYAGALVLQRLDTVQLFTWVFEAKNEHEALGKLIAESEKDEDTRKYTILLKSVTEIKTKAMKTKKAPK